MAYTVNKTNSSATPSSYTVQDSVINTQTDLSLIGKGYAGYGEKIAENFLHLLENFANTSAPTKPIEGQIGRAHVRTPVTEKSRMPSSA